jgi:hypothetical protein
LVKRPPADSTTCAKNGSLTTLLGSFDSAYGHGHIHAELVGAGKHVGDELVRKLMRELRRGREFARRPGVDFPSAAIKKTAAV